MPYQTNTQEGDHPGLLPHPHRAQIIKTSLDREDGKRALRYHDANSVICLAYPAKTVDSNENNNATREPPSGVGFDSPIWWNIEDGNVDFEDARTRWWIAGHEIEAYECL